MPKRVAGASDQGPGKGGAFGEPPRQTSHLFLCILERQSRRLGAARSSPHFSPHCPWFGLVRRRPPLAASELVSL